MDTGVRKLPKKRKFDPSELEENQPTTICGAPVSVVQSVIPNLPQAVAVDYSRNVRMVYDDPVPLRRQATIDLSEWCGHRVLAKQGDCYLPGVIRQAMNTDVSTYYASVAIPVDWPGILF